MSDENPSISQVFQKSNIINQSKLSSGAINNELLKNIEILEEENSQLKCALSELQEDLKEKENSIEESQKIITKLNDEYSKIIKELQNLEQINNDLTNENELNRKEIENAKKSNNLFSKLQVKYNELNNEINALKKENNSLKSKITNNNTTTNKKEKDLKNKDVIINNLKQKSDNWMLMIKERENLINDQSNKIKELKEVISRQEEELKLMMDFSKNINKENKTNVSEITKQAVKTIKLFYNSLNTSEKNSFYDNGYRIEFKNSNNNFVSYFENILKNNKISILLENAINAMMYIPKELKSISKEFIMDMNLKTELIKSELFSSIIRENHFIQFLQDIFGKFNLKDGENFKKINKIVILLKNNIDKISKENITLKKNNAKLLENRKNNDLLLKKFINDTNTNIKKLKEKYIYIINNMEIRLNYLQKNSQITKEKGKKDYEKLNKEVNSLKTENNNLKNNIEEYRRLLNIHKENEKLYNSLEEKNILNNTNNRYINDYNIKNISWNNNQRISENSFSIITSKFYKKININKNNRYTTLNYSINNNNYKDLNKETNRNIYNKKKKEINNLKEQIDKVKNEISNIMLNNTTINDDNNIFVIPSKDTNINSKHNQIKITSRSYISTDNNSDNLNTKINNLQKTLKKEKNKNLNLEKENILLKQKVNQLEIEKEKILNHNIFVPTFFVKLFYNINSKIFSSSELKKYYKIYNAPDINSIFEIFIERCECLKNQIYEFNDEIDSPNSEMEDNYVNSKNYAIDSSYRLVNEKILKLKKLEFDFLNLSEFVKNYLVSQEIIVNLIFNNDNNIIQFEPIEKLFNLFEECLNFKIDEMNDNVIFYRKLLIRIFKNQKNCLGLSLESITQK